MSMIWLLGAALAGNAVLHVGVHQRAGDLYNIAADGAAGQCVVAGCRIACPADGPVTFRWGPGGDWRLEGDTVVDPGMEGVAHVVPVEGSSQIHLEELDRLLVKTLTKARVEEESKHFSGTFQPLEGQQLGARAR